MSIRKNSNPSTEDQRLPRETGEQERVNDEDNLDTREISSDIEEGDEDYDDEELTEADFAIDDSEEEDNEEEL